MSRSSKRLPFFEEVSTKRDTATWWSHLQRELVDKNFKIIGLVSDRAKALVKLAKSEYLDSFSMPDLFHFMQDIGKTVGSPLGAQVTKAEKILGKTNCESVDYNSIKEDFLLKKEQSNKYKKARERINKTIHPFDESDQLYQSDQLDMDLRHLFTEIKSIAQQSNITISLSQASKILNQIPDLVGGVQHWINYLNTEVDKLELSPKHKIWLIKVLLPLLYWQFNLNKLCGKQKDKQLNQYYHQRVEYAQLRYETSLTDLVIEDAQKRALLNWGIKMVSSFHRSSSRVEGRNGYLAFMNHANKGITPRRKKVLTIIHNFDIRDNNGTTPAQRLFDREFPNLFEFILDDIGQLPLPRRRTMKASLKS